MALRSRKGKANLSVYRRIVRGRRERDYEV